MIRMAVLLEHVGLTGVTPQDFVKSHRKNCYARRSDQGYLIAFDHKFYNNQTEKLNTQTKSLNSFPTTTEQQAWQNAALSLLNLPELTDDNEVVMTPEQYAMDLTNKKRAFAFAWMVSRDKGSQLMRQFDIDFNEGTVIIEKLTELSELSAPSFNRKDYAAPVKDKAPFKRSPRVR